jgi:hypothetical protein
VTLVFFLCRESLQIPNTVSLRFAGSIDHRYIETPTKQIAILVLKRVTTSTLMFSFLFKNYFIYSVFITFFDVYLFAGFWSQKRDKLKDILVRFCSSSLAPPLLPSSLGYHSIAKFFYLTLVFSSL